MNAQYAAAYPELYRNHWWWRAREEILLRKIRRVLSGASPARILDVGCGAALFFDALEQSGHVEGIESDRTAVEGSGKWRSRIVVGELDDSYRPEAPFDLILLLDILEHVHDPDRLLRRAAEILTPSGRILITAPAFQWLWTAHDDLNHHVRRYTAHEMRSAIRRAGLVAVETGYMFQSLVVPKLLVRAREALTSRAPRVPGIPPPLLNSAVQAWFRAEYSLAGWLPFGGSLLAIAARSPLRSSHAERAC
jgi:2-polyprenyl-3-methyl-5-hydroxy-6-metoxy-1,4-benzoquinol methylase